MMIEGDSNWKSYGLNKKQADYCKAYIETGVKRKTIETQIRRAREKLRKIYRMEG